MAPKKHIHKYHKITLGFGQVWSCGIPECNHFMPRNMTNRVVGKASLCWNCGQQITLNNENMKLDRPLCADCNPTVSVVMDLLDKFGVK